jgi:hypothetical protein
MALLGSYPHVIQFFCYSFGGVSYVSIQTPSDMWNNSKSWFSLNAPLMGQIKAQDVEAAKIPITNWHCDRACNVFMPCFIPVLFSFFFQGVPVVEVRLRGSLSARSAIPHSVSTKRPLPLQTLRCFLLFFLFSLVQNPNIKAVTSL